MAEYLTNRKPAVAGKFYPASADALYNELAELFRHAEKKKTEAVRAVIVPHAGYIFSGKIAASGYSQIDSEKRYKHVFVLASSHFEHFEGASVYASGDFLMPMGRVKVDRQTCAKLIEKHPDVFRDQRSTHQTEHSLEVQLPFLQYLLGENINLVPIIVATQNTDTCKLIANGLQHYFNSDNLFIISTDFSHYPSEEDAKITDANTEEAILSNRPEMLMHTLSANRSKHIPGLQTSLCSWSSVLSLLYITENLPDVKYIPVDNGTSGDEQTYGDTNRVVGYRAIVVSVAQKKQRKSDC